MLTQKPKRYRYPAEIISYAIWMYHRFNTSYRDIEEMLRYLGILVSYETVRTWSNKFGKSFADVIKKKEPRPTDKWHLEVLSQTECLVTLFPKSAITRYNYGSVANW